MFCVAERAIPHFMIVAGWVVLAPVVHLSCDYVSELESPVYLPSKHSIGLAFITGAANGKYIRHYFLTG